MKNYDNWKLSNPYDDGFGYDMVSDCCGAIMCEETYVCINVRNIANRQRIMNIKQYKKKIILKQKQMQKEKNDKKINN